MTLKEAVYQVRCPDCAKPRSRRRCGSGIQQRLVLSERRAYLCVGPASFGSTASGKERRLMREADAAALPPDVVQGPNVRSPGIGVVRELRPEFMGGEPTDLGEEVTDPGP